MGRLRLSDSGSHSQSEITLNTADFYVRLIQQTPVTLTAAELSDTAVESLSCLRA